MRPIASLLALALAAAPAAAFACTPAPGYSVPTNLELAGQADMILLGQVAGGFDQSRVESGELPEEADWLITVHPLAAYKGLTPAQDFPIHRMSLAATEPSDPLEFEEPHPDALKGACIRRAFAPGAIVLFFLDRREGNWVPAGGAFSRWAEDVSGADAPWVQLARFYAAVAPLPEEDRKALLEAERDALLARVDDPAAQAMGGDIDRQLAGPNAPLVPPLPDPEEGFRDPAAPSAVQRALDAMRADRGEGE